MSVLCDATMRDGMRFDTMENHRGVSLFRTISTLEIRPLLTVTSTVSQLW